MTEQTAPAHTHYGYGHDNQNRSITHRHPCERASDHSHPDDFLVIYYDEDALRAGPRPIQNEGSGS